jgi:H+-transporting ATPase
MIWIAALVEAILSNWSDMGILLLIQFINATIAFYEVVKAGDAIAALKASLKPEATVKRDGKWKIIGAAGVVPGDLVLLASGSVIPADCRVNDGTIDVDQSQLTGESLPVAMYKDSPVKMGSTVVRGEVEATVEFTGANTFFGKTASLLQVKLTQHNMPARF